MVHGLVEMKGVLSQRIIHFAICFVPSLPIVFNNFTMISQDCQKVYPTSYFGQHWHLVTWICIQLIDWQETDDFYDNILL